MEKDGLWNVWEADVEGRQKRQLTNLSPDSDEEFGGWGLTTDGSSLFIMIFKID